jgi:peptidyl-prolyl cis-trans isomerase C
MLGVVAGCSGGSGDGGDGAGSAKIVAEAGDARVTLANFNDAYNKITPEYRPDLSTIEGRRGFANDLLNKEIMVSEGRRMGGIEDSAMVDAVERSRDSKMLALLYRDEVEAQVEVGGKLVADVYDKRAYNVKGSHIMLEDVDEAARIRQEIVSGEISFRDAARKYSWDESTKSEGGALPEIIWSLDLPEFEEALFEMEPGEVSQPIEGVLGVHLVRLEERIPQEDRAPLEQARPTLRSDVRRQLERIRMKAYVDSLQEAAGLTWHEDGLGLLLDLMEEVSKADIDTIAPADRYVPRPTDEQRAVPVASFSGRDWTIGDFVDAVKATPPGQRPVRRPPLAGLKELIRLTQLQNELLLAEAFKKGLDKNDEIVRERDRLYERILIEQVHTRFVQAADVPPEDVRAAYDSTKAENPDALTFPERVEMVILTHTDSSIVAQGVRRMRAGEPEEDVILELSMDTRTKGNGGNTGLIARGNYAPQIEDVAFSRSPDQGWSDPIVTESGTGAVRVVKHEDARLATFEEVQDGLTQQLARARGEVAFEEWLKNEREKRNAVVHDEVLELVGKPVS